MDAEISISDTVDADDLRELARRLDAFNCDRTGFHDYRPASCLVRDGTEVVAGIDGYTWGGMACVGTLWVDEALRKRGLGRRLVEAFEQEALDRGCGTIVLSTYDFQAPGLYEQLGYELVGTSEGTPRGHRGHHFRKTLGAAG